MSVVLVFARLCSRCAHAGLIYSALKISVTWTIPMNKNSGGCGRVLVALVSERAQNNPRTFVELFELFVPPITACLRV